MATVWDVNHKKCLYNSIYKRDILVQYTIIYHCGKKGKEMDIEIIFNPRFVWARHPQTEKPNRLCIKKPRRNEVKNGKIKGNEKGKDWDLHNGTEDLLEPIYRAAGKDAGVRRIYHKKN